MPWRCLGASLLPEAVSWKGKGEAGGFLKAAKATHVTILCVCNYCIFV